MLKTTALAALLAAALVGCGDSSSDDNDSSDGGSKTPEVQTTPDAAGAEQVMRTWTEAFVDRDVDTICDLGTEAYNEASVKAWNKDGWGAKVEDCEGLAKEAFKLYDSFGLTAADLKLQDVTIEMDGPEAAYATVSTGKTAADADAELYRLVWVDGAWRLDGDGELRMPEDAPKLPEDDD